jgi:hypothetical protein
MSNITKSDVVSAIAEEKLKYSDYISLCKYYQIEPDPRAQAFHQGMIQILNQFLTRPE